MIRWIARSDGCEYARWHGHKLRMRHAPSGYIISRREYDGWTFVAGDVRRDVAIRKAEAQL